MGQRLGVAVALLGDPAVLMLDEPVNGLDIDGVRWIRDLLRSLADEGRTVLLSSHLLSEVAVTADHLVVIRGGQLVADCSDGRAARPRLGASVPVETPEPGRLAALVARRRPRRLRCDGDTVTVGDADRRADRGARGPAGSSLHELPPATGVAGGHVRRADR